MNRFDEIKWLPLRVYNRSVFLHNLLVDIGRAAAEDYIKQFNEEEIKQMTMMTRSIKVLGQKVVLKRLKEEMPLEEENV